MGFLLGSGYAQTLNFGKYKAVETYEIRPGIMMMPRYSHDGQLCEIALQNSHFRGETVVLDSDLERKEIDELVDELAPADQRGAPHMLLGKSEELVTVSGQGMSTLLDYKKVPVELFSRVLKASRRGMVTEMVAATIKWRNQTCQ